MTGVLHWRGALRQDWLASAVATLVGANGLLSLVQSLIARPVGSSGLFGAILPFGTYPASRSLDAALGFVLVYLSFHLWQRRRLAWRLATVGTAIHVVVHLIASRHLFAVVPPGFTFMVLLENRQRFTVRTEPGSVTRGLAIVIASILFAVVYGTAGFELLDKRDFGMDFGFVASLVRTLRELTLMGNSDLVAHTNHAEWFLYSLRTVGIAAGAIATYSIFRPVSFRLAAAVRDRGSARTLVAEYGQGSYDHFKAWPDKSLFFDPSHRCFLGYRTVLSVAIVLGDAVGPPGLVPATTRAFLQLTNDNGWLTAFLFPDRLDLYTQLGLTVLKVGEEAVVDLDHFAETTSKKKYFRYVRRKLDAEGYEFVVYDPPHASAVINAAHDVSDAWLRLPRHREFGFAQGTFSRQYLQECRLFAVNDASGRMLAFANQVPSHRVGESTFDMMRRRPDIHWGAMDFLFQAMMLRLHEDGFKRFNMGIAPFVGTAQKADASLIERTIERLGDQLDWFVHSKGLRQYKDKFEPQWEPRYLAYSGSPISLARIGIAISRVL